MKFEIERGILLRVMGHVQPIVERRNTIPILSNVLIVATADGIEFSATDLDLQVREKIAVTVSQPGTTTVSANLLYDIIRKMPDGGIISIAVAEGRMAISSGRARFSLGVIPAEEFPNLAAGDLPTRFTLPTKQLAEILGSVRFAISTEETRYYLNGVYMHVTDEPAGPRLKAAATDGHRLSLSTSERPEGLETMPAVIVPRKCVAELIRAIEMEDGDVAVSVSSSKILFDFGTRSYLSKTIDGTFPDYTRVIPSSNPNILIVDPKELANGIDRVITIATEKTRAIKVSLEAERVVLSVTSPEHGTAVEEVAGSYSGKPFDIGFNARYLLEILQRVAADEIRIELGDSAAPVVFKTKEGAESLMVLMPMRV